MANSNDHVYRLIFYQTYYDKSSNTITVRILKNAGFWMDRFYRIIMISAYTGKEKVFVNMQSAYQYRTNDFLKYYNGELDVDLIIKKKDV